MKERTVLFTMGNWTLQKDTIWNSQARIASIRHECPGPGNYNGHTIWFNDKGSITVCYCGARVPDEMQAVCMLYNMEWLQEKGNNDGT